MSDVRRVDLAVPRAAGTIAPSRCSGSIDRPGADLAVPRAAGATGPDVAGFVVTADSGAVEFRLYGAGTGGGPSLVGYSEEGGHRAVLFGRLYYRGDLIARCGAALATAPPDNDAALALRLYRMAGIAGLERLEGEFALVIFDADRRQIVAMRDPHGGYPVYWCARGGGVALGSSLRALVELVPDAPLDVGTLAELLALSSGELDYHEATVFEGIHRLVSGALLTADVALGTATQRRYWNWSEQVVDPGTDRLDELGERYAETLRRAVRERLRGGVAAHLSGGMDSTAVALIARDELIGRGQRLHALSLVYERLDRLTEEKPYLDSALDRPGLVAHRIAADELLDFDNFGDATLYDEPFTGLYRAGADIAMIDTAARAGCQTILTGMGADEVLDTAPFYIADLLRGGHPLQAWSEAARWARALNKNPWSFLRRFGVAPLVPDWLAAGIGPLFGGGYASWGGQNPATIAPWVLPGFAQRGQLRQRQRARLRHNFPAAPSVVLSEAIGRLRHASGDWTRASLAAPRDIHIAHPFRDARVLALGLGARLRIRPTPQQQKPVLAEAMKDVLPAMILRRRDKAHFNAVYFAGLARNVDSLEDLVRGSSVDQLGLFDKDILVRCLRDAALGYRGVAGTIGLDNALVITRWLTLLPRWREARTQPSRVFRTELSGSA